MLRVPIERRCWKKVRETEILSMLDRGIVRVVFWSIPLVKTSSLWVIVQRMEWECRRISQEAKGNVSTRRAAAPSDATGKSRGEAATRRAAAAAAPRKE